MEKPNYVVFVHYHLRGGGVTRVIEHTVKALENRGVKTSVISGEAPVNTDLQNVIVIDKLSYGKKVRKSAKNLKNTIIDACRKATGMQPDIWHFHNHSLGKNLTIPLLVKELSDSGQKIVLQIHDFPEDGRPANYKYLLQNLSADEPGTILYPVTENIRYLSLNQRDKKFLINSGMPEDLISVLPNIVSLPDLNPDDSVINSLSKEYGDLVLYPTRGIRRKNIGEFILFSALNGNSARYAITLSPKNPDELHFYKHWSKYARHQKLPVIFNLVQQTPYQFMDLMQAASYIMTTSVTEGFGLAFLEPWLINQRLFGRNLPDITKDFSQKGIDLSSLYNHLDIPLDWIDQTLLLQKITQGLKKTYKAYHREFDTDYAELALNASINDNRIDFGRLDEDLQRNVISKIIHDSGLKKEISNYIPDKCSVTDEVVSQNRQLIEQNFNNRIYADRLLSVYNDLLQTNTIKEHSHISANRVLDQFLKPERFFLLRS